MNLPTASSNAITSEELWVVGLSSFNEHPETARPPDLAKGLPEGMLICEGRNHVGNSKLLDAKSNMLL
jgi:hypothetical protein